MTKKLSAADKKNIKAVKDLLKIKDKLDVPPDGVPLKFYASMRVRVSKTETGTVIKTGPTKHLINVSFLKNKKFQK
jgi:hypothetical protein